MKSHAIHGTGEIFGYLVTKLLSLGRFNLDYKGILIPSEGFWREFYSHLKPEILEKVVNSYHRKNEGKIALSLIAGEGVVQKVRILTGQ